VNAAFNIAATTRRLAIIDTLAELEETARISKKQLRKLVRVQPVTGIPIQAMTELAWCENILAVLE
jgi:hypothetical protein